MDQQQPNAGNNIQETFRRMGEQSGAITMSKVEEKLHQAMREEPGRSSPPDPNREG